MQHACEEVRRRAAQLSDAEVGRQELLRLARHLERCPECRVAFARLEAQLSAVTAARSVGKAHRALPAGRLHEWAVLAVGSIVTAALLLALYIVFPTTDGVRDDARAAAAASTPPRTNPTLRPAVVSVAPPEVVNPAEAAAAGAPTGSGAGTGVRTPAAAFSDQSPLSPAIGLVDIGVPTFSPPLTAPASDHGAQAVVHNASGRLPSAIRYHSGEWEPSTLIDSLDYGYPCSSDQRAGVTMDYAPSPFSPGRHLLRVGIMVSPDQPALLDADVTVEFSPTAVSAYRPLHEQASAWHTTFIQRQHRWTAVTELQPGVARTGVYEVLLADQLASPVAWCRVECRAPDGDGVEETRHACQLADHFASFETASRSFRRAAIVSQLLESFRNEPNTGAAPVRRPGDGTGIRDPECEDACPSPLPR